MKVKMQAFMLAATVLLPLTAVAADEPKPYRDGPVTVISSIRILPGGFDAYMKFLATTRKAIMEEQKKAGLITEWHVYSAQPRSPQEPDLLLTVTYKNWAALDGLTDKMEVIERKVIGSSEQANSEGVARSKIREVLGEETIQELIIK